MGIFRLDLEKEPRPGDLMFEVKGVRCFVDPMSSMYLMGVEVDYVEGQFGQSGFSFKNPNAKHTCGCGSRNIPTPISPFTRRSSG